MNGAIRPKIEDKSKINATVTEAKYIDKAVIYKSCTKNGQGFCRERWNSIKIFDIILKLKFNWDYVTMGSKSKLIVTHGDPIKQTKQKELLAKDVWKRTVSTAATRHAKLSL